MRADAAVAVAIQCRGVAARSTVTLAGDQIDERRFLGLLHGLPLSWAGEGCGTGDRTGLTNAAFGLSLGLEPIPRGLGPEYTVQR